MPGRREIENGQPPVREDYVHLIALAGDEFDPEVVRAAMRQGFESVIDRFDQLSSRFGCDDAEDSAHIFLFSYLLIFLPDFFLLELSRLTRLISNRKGNLVSRRLLVLIAYPSLKPIQADPSARKAPQKAMTIDSGNREAGESRRRTTGAGKNKKHDYSNVAGQSSSTRRRFALCRRGPRRHDYSNK